MLRNLEIANQQWQGGNWGTAGAFATGNAESAWSAYQSLETVYDPNTTPQERLLPATGVTFYALSWAPAPGSGGISSFLDDMARGGRGLLNSVSSCADDIARGLGLSDDVV